MLWWVGFGLTCVGFVSVFVRFWWDASSRVTLVVLMLMRLWVGFGLFCFGLWFCCVWVVVFWLVGYTDLGHFYACEILRGLILFVCLNAGTCLMVVSGGLVGLVLGCSNLLGLWVCWWGLHFLLGCRVVLGLLWAGFCLHGFTCVLGLGW